MFNHQQHEPLPGQKSNKFVQQYKQLQHKPFTGQTTQKEEKIAQIR